MTGSNTDHVTRCQYYRLLTQVYPDRPQALLQHSKITATVLRNRRFYRYQAVFKQFLIKQGGTNQFDGLDSIQAFSLNRPQTGNKDSHY